ncbi:MAG: hypothetical protein R3286_02615, partial [Gammaproteobacteria bacterium]|nr:hypothetical protein [Gammaproteobacteria bacterium]
MLKRRRFLQAGAGVPFGFAAVAAPAASARQTSPRIRRYVTLGDTGLRISDISFGSSRSDEPELVRHA